MKFVKTVATLTLLTALQIPCAALAAEEDRELALIAAEQEGKGDEKLDDLNPALTESLTTEQEEDTDAEKRERRRKLRETRREKEKENERKLRESTQRENKREAKQEKEPPIVIDPMEPEKKSSPQPEPEPQPQPVYQPPQPEPQPVYQPPQPKPQPEPQPVYQPPQPKPQPEPQPVTQPPQPVEPKQPESPKFTVPIRNQPVVETPQPQPQPVTTVDMPNPKVLYANFAEVAHAVGFTPLYMPRKSGYEIMELHAIQGIAEVKYGRRWEPNVSLTVRTHRRADGEEPRDISGVTGVKWRVDTTTGTTIYIAKISETQQVAAWAVGRYTFSALSENLSFAGFHSLVADELVELSTHYYLDI